MTCLTCTTVSTTENLTRQSVIRAMLSTYQFENVSVMEHGDSVHDYYLDIYHHLKHGHPLKAHHEWKLPEWIYDLRLIEGQMDMKIMRVYQIYHDCGKPFCRTVDEEGRQHFPNHAQVSKDIWNQISPTDPEIGDLIGMDMDIHLLKGDDVAEFAKRPQAMSLLLTGLAEIHSNARMFGGIESTSFKIKWKHLNKRGKAIMKELDNV